MSNDPTSRRPATKGGNTGAPMGSTISIIVAAVAVVVGFLILKNIQDDGGNKVTSKTPTVTDASGTTSSTSTTGVSVSSTSTPPTGTIPLSTTGATVIVANSSKINGSAGRFSDALGKLFTMGSPTNGVNTEAELDVSKVYYVPGPAAEAVARSVAQVMGGVAVETMPTPVNTKEGQLGDATVLVMLGKDKADRPLDAFSPATTTSTTGAAAALAPASNTTTTIGL